MKPAMTVPDKALVTVRPSMAKAELPDNDAADSLSPVVKEAVKRSYGKQGAGAAKLKKDEGNFARDVQAERMTLAELRALGRTFLAEFGRELLEQNGPLNTPQARLRQKARELREIANEVDQAAELIA